MNVYYTGRDLLSFGVVPLEDMFPETGLVKLMWALGQTDNPKEAIALLQANVAGEYTARTLPQDKIIEGGPQ
jgi:glutamyl-tRNA(Gln) amidotransferase subunit D